MALQNLQKSDLLLINRGTKSYKIAVTDFSKELGLDLENGNLVVDGNLSVNGNVVLGDPTKDCDVQTLTIHSETSIKCDLGVVGATVLEKTLDVTGVTTLKANATVQGNLSVTKNVFATEGTKTLASVVGGNLVLNATNNTDNAKLPSSYVGNPYLFGVVPSPSDPPVNPVELVASSGDGHFKGTVQASYFKGDGSQLVNLNLPGSLRFKGSIDCVTEVAPTTVATGDFYLNTGTGTIKTDGNWTGISGNIEEGDFVYFTSEGVTSSWHIGGGNDNGFVTLTTPQSITGSKSFTSIILAQGGVDASGKTVTTKNLVYTDATGVSLTLTGKATSASTERGAADGSGADADTTLTTKDYVDYASNHAKTEFKLTGGKNLITNGTPVVSSPEFDGSVAVTFDVDSDTAATPNKLVERDGSGGITGVDINANQGNVNVTNGDILVTTAVGSEAKGKISCPNDITTAKNVNSDKVITNEVKSKSYDLDMLTNIMSLNP